MREIKFRGRSLYEEKQWVYGLVFKNGNKRAKTHWLVFMKLDGESE